MVADDKVILFGQHANQNVALSSAAQQAIKACRETLSAGLPKSFAFFDGLDDALFDLADKAESNQKQEEYFTAMRQIRLVQADIKKNFTQKIVTDFDNFWKKPTAKSFPRLETNNDENLEIDESELSLLQNADLEEDIAIKRISSRSQSVCGNEVGKLSTRFAHMLNIDNVAKLDNPLDSDNVINHLKAAISPLPVSIPIKLVIYKQYEKQAVNSLFKLYQALNKQLIENGILPKIPYKTRTAKSAADRAQNHFANNNLNLPLDDAVDQHISHQGQISSSPDNQGGDLFTSLRQLLTHSSSRQNTNNLASSVMPTTEEQLTGIADHQSLLSALSSLQHQQADINISAQGNIELPEVRPTLLQTLNANDSLNGIHQAISPLDNDTLDIMDLLFEFILEDKNIPLPMRSLLARLQIPMLKIAITDKSFFQHKNHPARRLLNNLAQAATGWTQTKNYQQDPLYKHIDHIVSNLINSFETDIQIFDQINQQLVDFATQQQHSSEAIEKLTAETSQGQERVELAQAHVDKIIHDLYIEASPVPKVIVSLIEDGWKQSLRLRLIQKGEESEESEEWLTSISLIKQLLSSIKPTESEEERQQRLELIPGLHKEVQSYLQTTPITPNTLAVLLKALQRCHIKILNGDGILENELKHFDKGTAPEQNKIEDPNKRVELEMYSSAKAIDQVKKLKIGTWVDIQEIDREPRRIKFSWRSKLTKRCLFVTSKGIKAAEWSEQELAAMFEKGEASVLDQSKPLMDRALVSMMETVNKSH